MPAYRCRHAELSPRLGARADAGSSPSILLERRNAVADRSPSLDSICHTYNIRMTDIRRRTHENEAQAIQSSCGDEEAEARKERGGNAAQHPARVDRLGSRPARET